MSMGEAGNRLAWTALDQVEQCRQGSLAGRGDRCKVIMVEAVIPMLFSMLRLACGLDVPAQKSQTATCMRYHIFLMPSPKTARHYRPSTVFRLTKDRIR
jgi:hypothetical protein